MKLSNNFFNNNIKINNLKAIWQNSNVFAYGSIFDILRIVKLLKNQHTKKIQKNHHIYICKC